MTIDYSPVITAASFPHIIDSVIEYSSPSVLVAFRNTSTEYRKRISPERIARAVQADLQATGVHLHLDVQKINGENKLAATFATYDGLCAAPRYLAPWVHVVTLHAGALNGDFGFTDHAASLLTKANATLDVVRIVDFEGATSKIPFKAPKFVLFMNADHDEGAEAEDSFSLSPNSVAHTTGSPLDLPSNSNSSTSGSNDALADSPFPDNVTEIICNIACSPSAGCTNLTRSQISALNLGHRAILSNIIYIFRPIPEELESGKRNAKKEGDDGTKDTDKRKGKTEAAEHKVAVPSPPSRPSSPQAHSPALVPFLDNKLSSFPSPEFTIVGCENLRYWDDDPESTLFARFASIMNTYCDLDISSAYDQIHDVQVEVALGFNLSSHHHDFSRSNYFKSFPQWTASHARTPHERAWYQLISVP